VNEEPMKMNFFVFVNILKEFFFFTCKILIKTTSSSFGFVPTKRVCVMAFATLSIVDAADSFRVSFYINKNNEKKFIYLFFILPINP
jgi:hypothetical protein